MAHQNSMDGKSEGRLRLENVLGMQKNDGNEPGLPYVGCVVMKD